MPLNCTDLQERCMCMLTFEVISQTVALSLVSHTETSAALLTDCAGHHVSCLMKGALWMKSQTAVSVRFPLCYFPKNEEYFTKKGFSICICTCDKSSKFVTLLRSWNSVHDTTARLNCLCLTVPGLESLQHVLACNTQSSTALPSENQWATWDETIITDDLGYREAVGRSDKFNGFHVRWQCGAQNVTQLWGKETYPLKESTNEGKRKSCLRVCVYGVCEIASVSVRKWIGKE